MKPPKDVLGLGKHLVRELDFEDGVDTLGRWMTHHLAELINEAENGTTAAERAKAGKKATETILKIWEHRTSLPGKSYPLAPYKDLLIVLHRLRPDHNPFQYYRNRPGAIREQLAAGLFDNLTRLIIVLLLMRAPSDAKSADLDNSTIEALSDEEQYVLKTINEWFELLDVGANSTGQKRKRDKDGNVAKIDLNQAAVRFMNGIAETLEELRKEFQVTEDADG